MANPDLRDWLAQMEAAGELQKISGAERTEEIGGIVDIYQRQTNRPALLFDDIPGYPRGYRVAANILTGVKRIALTFGMSPDATEMDLVNYWRNYLAEAKSIPPVTVKTGPLLENVMTGKDINLAKIPTPKWHEDDGGPYIGTGVMVIMKDPDSGWINYGAYRVQVYDDPTIASVMISKGKHGDILMRKYHERGERCPIAVIAGMHPVLFSIAGIEIPYGVNEYDAAGGMMGEPVEVILGAKTGLPIPANAEIAFEGFIGPDDLIDEGRSANGRAITPEASTKRRSSASQPSCTATIRSCSAPCRRCRRATTRSIAAPSAAPPCGNSSKARAFPASRACGRTKPAAAASGSRFRSSKCTRAIRNRRA